MAWWIFQNLVITTVIATAVAVACRVWRIGPVARHALWVLVLVKFITPPLVVWPWAAPDPFGIAALDARVTPSAVALANGPRDPGTSVGGRSEPISAGNEVFLRTPPQPGDPPTRQVTDHLASGERTSPRPWLVGVWILGSLCLLAVEGARLVRLSRRISSTLPDPAIVARVEKLSAHLGIRQVPVVRVADITSPVVQAWGRPRILWPSNLSPNLGNVVTDACLDGILVHELAHIKRRDHLIGWIELAAGVVWWWNPLFWSVRSALREQAELACDAWVISALPNGRRAYAESLLALSGATLLNPSMAAVGIRPTSRRVLERRLVMIMKGRTSLRLPGVGLCCLALVAAATLPAWASAPQQPPPPPPTPVVTVSKQLPPPPAPVRKELPVRKVLRPKDEVVVYQTSPKVPPPPVPVVRTMPMRATYTVHLKTNLPEDGQQLLDTLDADLKAIQEEANQKTEARRASAVKALEALQEQYTKAGKLDEAVAIRDYLRAGGPAKGLTRYTYTIKRQP